MKILQAIGLLIAVFGFKFIMMWTVFRAFEHALVAVFNTIALLMGSVGSTIPLAPI